MNDLHIKIVDYQQENIAIAAIRTKVFNQEQGIAEELEFDGLDEEALHLLAYLADRPIGTTRLRSLDSTTMKIERLAVLPEARRKGVATKLMSTALKIAKQNNKTIALVHAQAYILPLYQKLGFELVGEPFEEAGIPHRKAKRYVRSRSPTSELNLIED